MWNAERQGRALLSSIQAQRYWLSQVRPQTGGRRPRAQIDGVEAYIADGAVAGKPAWCGPRAIVRSSACPISTG